MHQDAMFNLYFRLTHRSELSLAESHGHVDMKDEDPCSTDCTQAQKRVRLGRPPGDPLKARSERLVTFVTREEMQFMKMIGAENNKSLSAVCYELLTDALARERTEDTEHRQEQRTARNTVANTRMENQ